jgi:hypothetical protein
MLEMWKKWKIRNYEIEICFSARATAAGAGLFVR